MFWKQGKLLNLIKFYKYSVIFAALLTGQPLFNFKYSEMNKWYTLKKTALKKRMFFRKSLAHKKSCKKKMREGNVAQFVQNSAKFFISRTFSNSSKWAQVS